MSQKAMHLMAPPDQLGALTTALRSRGFRVSPSGRLTGGIHVLIRVGTGDEAEVEHLAAQLAPDMKRGPSATPTHDIAGYREG